MTIEEYASSFLEEEIRIIENSFRMDVISELSVFEKAIIYKYSDNGYEDLNERLRKSKGENMPLFAKLLDKSLSKLPDFTGFVFRGIDLSKAEFKRYQDIFDKNELLTENFFISTSRNRFIGNQFGTTRFELFVKNGKAIEQIAKYNDEKEVVLRYNSVFVISRVDDYLIQLNEV